MDRLKCLTPSNGLMKCFYLIFKKRRHLERYLTVTPGSIIHVKGGLKSVKKYKTLCEEKNSSLPKGLKKLKSDVILTIFNT